MKIVRVLTLFLIAPFLTTAVAQQSSLQSSSNAAKQSAAATPPPVRPAKRIRPKKLRPTQSVIPPVTLLHNPEFLSGEASVAVAANSNPLIRIGMAQNGVTLIEFPAADKFFAVHAGNSDLVTVEKSPSLKRDHHLILRAGSGFVVSQTKPKGSLSVLPATSIMAQMDSGMAITLMIYPVPLLKQQAHRLVISYNRDDVISARRTAGLATNLVLTEPTLQSEVTLAPRSKTDKPTETNANGSSQPSEPTKRSKPDFKEPTESAVREAAANPKWFKKWATPRHGLTISAMSARELNDSTRLVLFAVRNVGTETVRLISGYPDLYVETLNENRRPVETERRIEKLYFASSSSDNSIPAGGTLYFALTYEAPILGVRQHLKIVVAHMNAADEPAMADLTARAK